MSCEAGLAYVTRWVDGQAMSDPKRKLPKPVAPPLPHYSINQAEKMVGKTVASVEVGHRERIAKVHSSELIVIHFTDGSSLSIDTGSNVGNGDQANVIRKPEEVRVDFHLEWFPSDQGK